MRKRGICLNLGSCEKADSNEVVIVTGDRSVCDSCGCELSPVHPFGVFTPRVVVLSVMIIVCLAILGLEILPGETEKPSLAERSLVTERPIATEAPLVTEKFPETEKVTVTEEVADRAPIETTQRNTDVVTASKILSEGQRLMARGQHRDARDAFARAAELDDKNAFAWANLGAAEMILGEPRAAKRAYDAALRADDDNWLALYNLGVYFVRTGDTGQAVQRLGESLRVLEAQGAQDELRAVLSDLETNSTFSGVRHDPRFRSLLAR